LARRRWAGWALPALAPILAATILTLAVTGCGESGAAPGATVSVYLSAPMQGPEGAHGRELCTEAKRALAAAHGKAGDLHLQLRCLDASGPGGAWTLAAVGTNARQATQDSTTVAYIGESSQQARLQSRPIVEEAGIAEISAGSGSSAMQRILDAVPGADPESLRSSVREALSGS
jgi:branched-chain amino acid transport system substrate-binding protein